ncbi:MAG: hypothetical protein NZ902_05200 [Acidilobaceae archaeon]|nr:hypothetical protein [Acidilobaceae archaeon]MDW7974606.1 hypothetical protein [Sulfolobales archaeon]
MDRRAAVALLLAVLLALINFNTLTYRAPLIIRVYPSFDESHLCFGFQPGVVEGLDVSVLANGKVVCRSVGEDVFESLKVFALLPPGAYMIKVGKIYVSTTVPRLVTMYVEEGVEGADLRALLRGNGKVYELSIRDGGRVVLLVPTGTTSFEVWIYLNVTVPGVERFRIGAYLNSQNG